MQEPPRAGSQAPRKTGRVVIIGDSALAQMACEYFEGDSPYEVVGFAVEKAFRQRDELLGKPVVDFETMESRFPVATHHAFLGIGYNQLNRVRRRLFHAAKAKGYTLASYISSKAFVWRNVKVGENAYILEHAQLQPWVEVGDAVFVGSGVHIAHHSKVANFAFLAAHSVICGYTEIGECTFIGANATVGMNMKVGRDCLIGGGASVMRETKDGQVFGSNKPDIKTYDAYSWFKVPDDQR